LGYVSLWFMQVEQFSIKEKADDYINMILNGILK